MRSLGLLLSFASLLKLSVVPHLIPHCYESFVTLPGMLPAILCMAGKIFLVEKRR